jgi:nucleoside-diphosphate-sugar epimerase
MKILITGATGYIGNRLLKLLKTTEHEVRLLSRKRILNYDTILCDLNEEIPEVALKSIDIVLHCAGVAHDFGDANQVADMYHRVNVEATKQLAEISVNFKVKRFVFVSSTKAGGNWILGRCSNEDDQGRPEGVYGKTKREAELKLLKIGKESDMHVSI